MASGSIDVGLYKMATALTGSAHAVQRPCSLQLPTRKKTSASSLGSSFTGMHVTVSSYNRQRVKFNPLSWKNETYAVLETSSAETASVPFTADLLLTAEGRALLAEDYGFTRIGEPVPEDVTLRDIIDSLPPEVFVMNPWKAWRNVAITVAAYGLGLFWISKSPWYMLPFACVWTGTAVSGFFVISHDCAHKLFSKNKIVEDIVGTVAMLPIIYPYEGWRFEHNRHHANTNMLVEDTAWHPWGREDWESSPGWLKTIVEVGLGPIRPWVSIMHWLEWHFDWRKFRPNQQNRVKISVAVVVAFMALVFPTIIYFTGISGWVKFWLLPWLVFHFWLSTFTMTQHTAPHIPFKDKSEWNAAAAQLGGTVHVKFPFWVEFLNHDLQAHVPHHVTQTIPVYNCLLATDSLRQNWGKHLNEATWNWRLMKTIMTRCHIFEDGTYVPFDDGAIEESKILGWTRKFMPNTR